MALKLTISGQTKGIDGQLLQAAVSLVAGKTGAPDGVINLKLVDDAEIRDLNKSYSGKNTATDVLSFSYLENGLPPASNELGDLAISLDTAKRQALAAGTDLVTELALLVIHGCLHILGYDHAELQGKDDMNRLQQELMDKLGLKYRDFQWAS